MNGKMTQQLNNKPTKKVFASSAASAIVGALIGLFGIDVGAESLVAIEQLVAGGVVALISFLTSLLAGYVKKPSKDDQVIG